MQPHACVLARKLAVPGNQLQITKSPGWISKPAFARMSAKSGISKTMNPGRKASHLRCILAMLLPLLCMAATGEASPTPEAVQVLIQQAGNAEDDGARLDCLRKLQQTPGLAPELKADAGKLVTFVERWLNEPSLWKWYDREVRQTTDYDFKIAPDSPLHPLACFFRGRMLVSVANEYGNILSYREPRRQFFDKAVEQFWIAAAAFPRNRVLRMYLGEPIPPARHYPEEHEAPRWARLQRESLERLAEIVLWWIEHRQRPDGQYGGDWDDDCEMWRSWVPVMIAFEHPRITRAQAIFSDALLQQSYMRDGYTSRLHDVEHTAEPSTDTILPMMHLAPEEPRWRQRAQRIAELMETVWTGTNQHGQLQFKSTFFNATRADTSPRRACDTPYCVRAVQPALLLWQRTGDQKLGALFSRWMDTWVDAAARAEHGKPAGIVPAAIHWPDGAIKGPGENWWDPRHHDEPTLYEWPAAVGALADALLLTWHMTGDEKYLRPIRSMAETRRGWLQTKPAAASPGSEAWCGSKLGLLAGTLAKYKLLTGSGEFDAVLARDDPAGGMADQSLLADELERTTEALRINFPAYTSEVRFTDRVFAFARLYREDFMFPQAMPANAKQPNLRLLYATATGDRGELGVFPLNAVRWLTPPQDLAALVTHSSRKRFRAELFHFGHALRQMSAELYLLSPGRYSYDFRETAGGQRLAASKPLSVDGTKTRLAFELPPRTHCQLEILPADGVQQSR